MRYMLLGYSPPPPLIFQMAILRKIFWQETSPPPPPPQSKFVPYAYEQYTKKFTLYIIYEFTFNPDKYGKYLVETIHK